MQNDIENIFLRFLSLTNSDCNIYKVDTPVIYHEKPVSNIIEIISRRNVHFRRNYVPVFFQNKCFKIAETCMMTSCNRLHATVVDKTVYK